MKNASSCQCCGCSHDGQCYRKTEACFGCDKVGHMLKDCPKRRFGPDNAATDEDKKKSKLQGRVFAISEQDADVANNVVSD
ncbi:hypothetical protein ACOSP7_020229 [Xanthoceras sorbifolium]